ncbi:hypothetical protein OG21DRAFT_1526637 [Imleria badia]|nr:hypothetical protein OG21DRAFT_1526637 [Imleria badia]
MSSLERESQILEELCKDAPVGIPRVHWFGREANFNVLVLDLLGPSLQRLIETCIKFDPVTVWHVGDQLAAWPTQLSRLQYIHSHGYIHGDVKTANLSMLANRKQGIVGKQMVKEKIPKGVEKDRTVSNVSSVFGDLGLWRTMCELYSDVQRQNILTVVDHSTIFLIDFSLSKPYLHLTTGKHLPFCPKCGLNGTPAFASINNHMGDCPPKEPQNVDSTRAQANDSN